MLLIGSVLMLTTWFNGAQRQCVVDTGSSLTLVRSSEGIQFDGPSQELYFSTANGGLTKAIVAPVKNIGTKNLGWVNGEVVVSSDLAEECILGSNFLGRQPIIINWSNGTVLPAR